MSEKLHGGEVESGVENSPKPLEGEYREAWGDKLPDPAHETYIDSNTGEVFGLENDIKVRKDEKTNEWVVISSKYNFRGDESIYGETRIPAGKGEFSLIPKFNGSEIDSCPREWSVWKDNQDQFSIEEFKEGERGEASFSDLKSAVNYILDREDGYELRDGRGYSQGTKPYTGTMTESNSFNYGMRIQGKNSGKQIDFDACAEAGTKKITVTLESQQWYVIGKGKESKIIGVLQQTGGLGPNGYVSKKLDDNEVIIELLSN